MKKTTLIAIASLVTLASTAANAGGFYFGFTDHAPAPRYVYVAPQPRPIFVPARPVFYAPQPVAYYAPRGYSKWQHYEWKHRHHRDEGRYRHAPTYYYSY